MRGKGARKNTAPIGSVQGVKRKREVIQRAEMKNSRRRPSPRRSSRFVVEVEAPRGDSQDTEPTSHGDAQRQEVPSRVARASLTTVEARPDWYNDPAICSHPADPHRNEPSEPTSPAVKALWAHANEIWRRDSEAFAASRQTSSSHKFLATIMASGTTSDKIAALALAIQDAPVHNFKAIDSLVGMANKKSKEQTISALSAVIDLFGPGLLLPDKRRLRRFSHQPALLSAVECERLLSWSPGAALPRNVTAPRLILWAFEDWLKDAYFRVIRILEASLHDDVAHSRMKATDFVYTLLREKPEQESNLMRLLVHRLGDADKRICSRASHLLLQLLDVHPVMKEVTISCVEQEILSHPNQSSRARYYAITTLNQIMLSAKEPQIADALQKVYFAAFLSDMHKQPSRAHPSSEKDTETQDKLVSALLTGINRAIPFSQTAGATLETYLCTLFRIAHSSNLNTGIQALILMQHISCSREIMVDRYYRTLYESLLDPRLAGSSKHTLYLNNLFRSMKSDPQPKRVKAFLKRLLQISVLHQPSFVCGALFLLAELQKTSPDLCTMLEEPEACFSLDRDLGQQRDDQEAEPRGSRYNGRKREPEFSNAQESCLWEIVPFSHHFHPSVSMLAKGVVSKQTHLRKPDMSSHTLVHFLDRFAFRHPKTTVENRGASVMQPLASAAHTEDLLPSRKAQSPKTSLNAPAFWKQDVRDVSADKVFFHSYFALSGKARQDKSGITQRSQESDEDGWNPQIRPRTKDGYDSEGDSFGDDSLADFSDWDVPESDPSLGTGSETGEDEESLEIDETDSDHGSSHGTESKGVVGISEAQRIPIHDAKCLDGRVKGRRKLMRSLPVFAPAEEYERLLSSSQ